MLPLVKPSKFMCSPKLMWMRSFQLVVTFLRWTTLIHVSQGKAMQQLGMSVYLPTYIFTSYLSIYSSIIYLSSFYLSVCLSIIHQSII